MTVVSALLQVMVFFSSCNSVKFHSELLNYIDIPVKAIHGKQKQAKRTTTFFEFCQAGLGMGWVCTAEVCAVMKRSQDRAAAHVLETWGVACLSCAGYLQLQPRTWAALCRQTAASCSAQTWRLAGLTSRRLTGSSRWVHRLAHTCKPDLCQACAIGIARRKICPLGLLAS